MRILTSESGCDYMIHISKCTGMHIYPSKLNFLPPNKSTTKSVAQLHVLCL